MSGKEGKIGCGCLFFLLLLFLVALGIFFHPVTLRFLSKQLVYKDRIYFSEVGFIPRFSEDEEGELYSAAFEELRKGNVKEVWVEDHEILETSLSEILKRMAKKKGFKEDLVKGIKIEGKDFEKSKALVELLKKAGIKKAIIMVPEYASRRYRILFGNSQGKEPLFLISPVSVKYFNHDRWWKEGKSRKIVLDEYASLISIYLGKFKYGKIFGS